MSDHLTDWKANKRIAELENELDQERASGIHSCGPHCQRLGCRQRREIERLQARVEELEGVWDAASDFLVNRMDDDYAMLLDEALAATEQEGEW